MFSEKLKNLREKPAHVKDRIVIICLVVAFVLVFILWYCTFDFNRFDLHGVSEYIEDTKTYIANEPKIFDEKMPDNFVNSITSTSTQANPISSTSTAVHIATTTESN